MARVEPSAVDFVTWLPDTVQALFQRDTEQRQNHRGRLSLELKRRDHPDCIAAAHPQPNQSYTRAHTSHTATNTHKQGEQDMCTHSAGGPKRGVWHKTLPDAATRPACDTQRYSHPGTTQAGMTKFCPAAMRHFNPTTTCTYLPTRQLQATETPAGISAQAN